MFKTYNVADTLWQMNLFFTMQVHRSLSTLSYLDAPHSTKSEPQEEPAKIDDYPVKNAA